MFFDLTWQKGPKKEKQNLNFKKTKQFHSILVCLFFSKVFICVWYPLALIRFSSFILKRGLKVKQTQSHKLHILEGMHNLYFSSIHFMFSFLWIDCLESFLNYIDRFLLSMSNSTERDKKYYQYTKFECFYFSSFLHISLVILISYLFEMVKKITYFIIEKGIKEAQLLKFHIFGRHTEFLFIQFLLVFYMTAKFCGRIMLCVS